MLSAALGLGAGAFGSAAQANPHSSKGAVLQLPLQYSKREMELLRAGGSPYCNRKPWAFRGKNRSQRNRLATAFCNF